MTSVLASLEGNRWALGSTAARHTLPNKRAGDSEVRNALVEKRFRSLFRLETMRNGRGLDARTEKGAQAAGHRSGKNGSSGWLAGNQKRLFRQGKSVFFGVKFSSSPKRLFDMFRMRGLERAAAAIRGNGCHFGAIAGDGISAIEVPLTQAGAEQENAAAPFGAAASLRICFPIGRLSCLKPQPFAWRRSCRQ